MLKGCQLKYCAAQEHRKVLHVNRLCLSRLYLTQGIGLQPFPVPLHRIQLQSGFVNGEVIIAVHPTLPIDNIDMIIGNNLGGDVCSLRSHALLRWSNQ